MIEKGYGASKIGKHHIKQKIPNQDSYFISNKKSYTLAVVCDGLGSKKYSHIGSKCLCRVINRQIKKAYKKKMFDIESFIPLIKRKWKNAIWPINPRQADTTCIFVLINDKNILLSQIGDGLCVLKESDNIIILSLKNSDFSNETITFNGSSINDWAIRTINKEPEKKYNILLCTDGISEDLKEETMGEFIDYLSNIIKDDSTYFDNIHLQEIISNWPNKYSNDDKTMVVIK